MSDAGFAYSHLFTKNLPPPAPHWTGFPKYNFIGGHNDPVRVPAEALAVAATAVLRRRGADLALYNFDGPQGYRGLREFVVDKVSHRPAIKCSVDDVLITSGSGQGIDLVNQLLLEGGDTVILEEFTYGGALTKLKRLGVNVIGGLIMGIVVELGALKLNYSPETRAFLTTGILGGFTTFSAFSLDTALLIERGDWLGSAVYAVASVALSVGALFTGLWLVRAFA